MIIDLLWDVAIILLLFLAALFGYGKGIFALLAKPINKFFRLGAAFALCIPISELLFPMITFGINNSTVNRIISVIASFVLISVLGGWLLTVLYEIVTSLFNIGILGGINRIVGAIFTTLITTCAIMLIIPIYQLLGNDVRGYFVRFLLTASPIK